MCSFVVTGMGFEPILSALRTQRLNRLTNRPCDKYYSRFLLIFQVFPGKNKAYPPEEPAVFFRREGK